MIVTYNSISKINEEQWQLLNDNCPFLDYHFLLALEKTECVNQKTGWMPYILVLQNSTEDSSDNSIQGVLLCYIKSHSYGEFVFDWQWAQAYEHHGLQYYPKLTSTIPFSPVQTNKILFNKALDSQQTKEVVEKFISHITHPKQQALFSSLHMLFIEDENIEQLSSLKSELKPIFRHDVQYHWNNNSYLSFDDFLQSLQSKKRKNIKQERRSIAKQEIKINVIEGSDLSQADWLLFYQCYYHTVASHHSNLYLNYDFFKEIGNKLPSQIMMLQAVEADKDKAFACALFFKSENTLYGRYWGTLKETHCLHFELCYYQAIDYCIKHNLSKFEAGAQGNHKLSRGLTAQKTTSAHWIFNKSFKTAIVDYVNSEKQEIEQVKTYLDQHSPFKKTDGE